MLLMKKESMNLLVIIIMLDFLPNFKNSVKVSPFNSSYGMTHTFLGRRGETLKVMMMDRDMAHGKRLPDG